MHDPHGCSQGTGPSRVQSPKDRAGVHWATLQSPVCGPAASAFLHPWVARIVPLIQVRNLSAQPIPSPTRSPTNPSPHPHIYPMPIPHMDGLGFSPPSLSWAYTGVSRFSTPVLLNMTGLRAHMPPGDPANMQIPLSRSSGEWKAPRCQAFATDTP